MDSSVGMKNVAQTEGGRQEPPTRLKAWLKLLVALLLMGIFIFGFVPWWNQLPMVAPISNYIEDNDIQATALFYSEVEETAEAEVHIKAALKYNMRQP